MVAILVMQKPMLLESLGLDGEHVTWAVGLVLIPLGQPGEVWRVRPVREL